MGDEFENAKGKVFVSVYPSNLKDKDGNRIGKCVGKVKKNVASVEQLVSRAKCSCTVKKQATENNR